MAAGDNSSASTAGAGPSRRAFLAAGALTVVVGAAGGAVAEVLRDGTPVRGTPRAPDALRVAVTAEQERIGALDAALSGAGAAPGSTAAALLMAIRANHVAHEQALRSLLPQPQAGAAPPFAGPAPSRASLAAAEAAAGRAAAAAALGLTGGAAALLASIAACEAAHAQVLS